MGLLKSLLGSEAVGFRPSRTLEGHGADVSSLSFSPDGLRLASGSADKTLRIWRVETGRPEHVETVQGFPTPMHVAWAPRGDSLVTGSFSHDPLDMLKVWDPLNRMLQNTLDGHESFCAAGQAHPNGLAFSRGGALFASAFAEGTVLVWKTEGWRVLLTLVIPSEVARHARSAVSVAFSPDESILASSYMGGMVAIWRISDGSLVELLRERRKQGEMVTSSGLAFAPDGSMLASGGTILDRPADEAVKLWDTTRWRQVRSLNHGNWPRSVDFSPDGEILASGGADNEIKLWRSSDGRRSQVLKGHRDSINCLTFSPDGQLLASGSADGAIVIWQR